MKGREQTPVRTQFWPLLKWAVACAGQSPLRSALANCPAGQSEDRKEAGNTGAEVRRGLLSELGHRLRGSQVHFEFRDRKLIV